MRLFDVKIIRSFRIAILFFVDADSRDKGLFMSVRHLTIAKRIALTFTLCYSLNVLADQSANHASDLARLESIQMLSEKDKEWF